MAHSRSDYLLVLAPIWAPIAGLFFALLSFSVLHEVSRGILTPEEVSFWLPEAYEHLGWGVPVLAAITLGRFRRWLGVIFMVGAVFGYASGSCMHGGILSSGPLLHGAQDAPATLSFAAPVRNWDDGPYEYDRFDSETMSRIFPHQAYRQQYQMEFNFVPAEQASTGPTVVSVHPIDRWNWGAAGLSRYGHRYLILEVHRQDPVNPQYGSIERRWGRLLDGEECLGLHATPESVTAPDFKTVR